MRSLLTLTFFLGAIVAIAQKQIAFPGAQGFGKYATGGRGGKVILVTNLNDSGPGSLRKAIQQKTPRIIVFTVSGTIALESALNINYGNLTIAGQSAPGDGICIKNYPLVIKADNVIIRFMRFRLGDERGQQDDAITANRGNSNIIIDHCSMSWATDECASFYYNKNFTLQWSMITESLNNSVHEKGEHGYGGIWGGENASFHHNLIANHNSRLPRFSGSSTTRNSENELVDFRNNVVYNWMHNNTYGGERGRYNFVGNYYKPGPSTKESRKNQILDPSSPYGKFYVMDNWLAGSVKVTENNREGVKTDFPDSVFVANPFVVEEIEDESAKIAYMDVLRFAGASFKRDAVDARIVEEVGTGISVSGKGKNGIIDSQKDVGGWPELKSVAPPTDTDQDGIPDGWEEKNKLNPNDPTDAVRQSLEQGYDNVEVYLNTLVAHLFSPDKKVGSESSASGVEQNTWYEKMATSEMQRTPDASLLDFVKEPKWNYTNGLICLAIQRVYEKTGRAEYFDYIKAYADKMIDNDGSIHGYKPDEYNIDKVNSGKFLFALHEKSKDEKYSKAIQRLRDQMRSHPRTKEGGFWHKKIYPNQMWLDGLYMGAPFLAQYARSFNEPKLFDDVALQIKLIDKNTFNPSTGLYHHAWDESREQKWANKKDGKSPEVWGRAMGWFAMALVDVLDFFPKDHPERKNILAVIEKVANGVCKYQDKKTGVWYQVIDKGSREGNYLEASASAMFTYFLLKAVDRGYLGKKYAPVAEKAYHGVIEQFIRTDDSGRTNITNVCAVAGLGGDPYRDGTFEYYINEQKRDNDPKAVGPFIMMSLEYENFQKTK
jgi:rhamnogalacturonyl hydrolase YesR